MRTLTKIAFAAVAMLVLVAMLTPAEAACGSNPLIRTRTGPEPQASFVWNPAMFAASYYSSPTYGPFPPFGPGSPWSPAAEATFWALGTGNPTIGPGDDAGAMTFPTYPWMYYNQTYYYATYGQVYAGEIFAGWGASAGIDGCVQNNPVGACTCVLITDDDGVNGYFALASDGADPNVWHTDLVQPGSDPVGHFAPIKLAPIPAPTILASARKGDATLNLDITVTVPPLVGPAQGIYQSGDTCACGPVGYKVMQAIVLRGSPPPTSRTAGWTVMNQPGAVPQVTTPMGSPVTVESLCGSTDQDVYITTQLEFDSGFTAPVVSGDSTRIECGPNMAEPVRPKLRPSDIRPPARQPTRGRR